MSERTSKGPATVAAVSEQINNPEFPTLTASQVRELISRRAYEIYTQRETGFDDELSDWLKAEAEVVTMLLADPQQSAETETPNGLTAARPRTAPRVSKAAEGAHQRVSRWSKRKIAAKGNPA
jgi:hypothetical protein